MNREELLSRIANLIVWSRRGQRSPSKPLLLLYALGAYVAGTLELPFRELEDPFRELLREFGPARSSYHPEYPFWRLQNDGLWSVSTSGELDLRRSNSDPTLGSLRAAHAVGSLSTPFVDALRGDSALVSDIAGQLLSDHFPVSLHEDILSAVGLDLRSNRRPRRDPAFRGRVLSAYGYRCAICNLDARLGSLTVGLEAAHIKWHQHNGPDTEANGIALCPTHHKLFDLGAFTLQDNYLVVVSQYANGNPVFVDLLLVRHATIIHLPRNQIHHPRSEFVAWHRREVFRHPAQS